MEKGTFKGEIENDTFDSVKVEKLSEYIKFVEDLDEGFILSRGQSQNYNLLPSSLRRDQSGNRRFSKKVSNHFLEEFKINSHSFLKSPWDIKTHNEWMVMAQHHGIPTRLLDFTYSHIVSLMFAVEKAFIDYEEKDAEVWFLNPTKLNLKFANRNEILKFGDDEKRIDDMDGPVAIKGRKLNERINSQNGLFVYFQHDSKALDEIVEGDILKRVVIKGEYKKEILSSLYTMGIGFTSIYPELDSVSKDIILKNHINEYLREEI